MMKLKQIKNQNYFINNKIKLLITGLIFSLTQFVSAQCGADIFILNDNSGSVDATELKQSKEFITRLGIEMTPLGTATNQTRIAIADFANTNEYQQYDFPIATTNYTTNLSDIVSYENSPRILVGGTNVSYGISAASVLAGLPQIPGRNVAQIFVILTDAYPSQIPPSIISTANTLKSKGFSIIIMAIDEATADLDLPNAASSGGYFTAGDYQALENNVIAYAKNLASQACTYQPPTPTPDLNIALSNFTVTNCLTTPNYSLNYQANNTGTAAFSGNLYISLYDDNPSIPGTNLLGVYNAGAVNIGIGSSFSGTITNTNIPKLNTTKNLYALVNFDGNASGNQVPVSSNVSQSQLYVSPEKDTQNNLSAVASLISGSGCDMAVLDVSVNADGGACSDAATYTVQICNNGTQPANIDNVIPAAGSNFVLTNSTSSGCTISNTYTQLGSTFNGTLSSQYLGESSTDLSANGNTMVIGQRSTTNATQNVGVYDWNGTAWVLRGAFIPIQRAGEGFGSLAKLSANGNTVVIGAYYNNLNAGAAGAVYVFDWNGTAWVKRGNAIYGTVISENLGTGESATVSVDMTGNGNTLILGSFTRNASTSLYAGRAAVYDWNGTSWVKRGTDIYGANVVNDKFGIPAISDDGNNIVIGASKESTGGFTNNGSVRAYSWNGTNWIQRGSTIYGGGHSVYLGRSVEMTPNGNTIIVGSDLANNSQVYDWNGTDWVLRGAMIPSIGSSVDISSNGNSIILGNYRSGAFPWPGSVSVYDWNGTTWAQRGTSIVGASGDYSGLAACISGDGTTIGIASPYANTSAGLVRAYRYQTICQPLAVGSCYTYTYTYDASAAVAGKYDFDVIVQASKVNAAHANPIINPDKNFTAQNTATIGNGFDGSNHLEDDITLFDNAFCATTHTMDVAVSFNPTAVCEGDFTTATVTITNPYPINIYNTNLTLNLNNGSTYVSEPYNLSNILLPANFGFTGTTGSKTIPVYSLAPGINTFNIDISAVAGTTIFTSQLSNIDPAYNNGSATTALRSANLTGNPAPTITGSCPANIPFGTSTISLNYSVTGASSVVWASGTSGVFSNPNGGTTTYTINPSDEANGYVDFTLHAKSSSGCDYTSLCRVNITGVNRDYGDAPITYDLNENMIPVAAAHSFVSGLYLGATAPDAETQNKPSPAANFDNFDDGLLNTTLSIPAAGSTYSLPITITNTSSKVAYANAFIDWNLDGDFLDDNETGIVVTVPTNSGTNSYNINFTVPLGVTLPLNTYVRVRVSVDDTAIKRPFAAAGGGEVEDYSVVLQQAISFVCPPDPYAAQQTWWLANGFKTPIHPLIIDFKTGTPVVSTPSTGYGNGYLSYVNFNGLGYEGNTTVTHPVTKQFLFATDGNTLFRGSDGVAATGTSVGGGKSAGEAAAVIPDPNGILGQSFLILGNTSWNTPGGLNMSKYDLVTNTLTNLTTLLPNGSIYEGLEVIPHTNGNDYWILVNTTDQKVKTYLYSKASGFNSTPVSSTDVANLAGVNSSSIAVNSFISWNPKTPGKVLISRHNKVGLANFDPSTGALGAWDVKVTYSTGSPDNDSSVGYSVALSPNGRYIYYAVDYDKLMYYDLLTSTSSQLATVTALSGVKIGPDNKLYVVGYPSFDTGLYYYANPDSPSPSTSTLPLLNTNGYTVPLQLPNNVYWGCITCQSGTAAPALANTNITTNPATVGDLITLLSASNKPAGTVITIHSGTPATDANKLANSTAIVSGTTYYAAFYDGLAICYSPTTAVTVGTTYCYKPAVLDAGNNYPTKHGITSLGRAGTDSDNWPMVRQSAWTALESKTKGFVVNRVRFNASNQPVADDGTTLVITSPVEGMMVYDTTNNCLKVYTSNNGGSTFAWHCMSTQACPQ